MFLGARAYTHQPVLPSRPPTPSIVRLSRLVPTLVGALALLASAAGAQQTAAVSYTRAEQLLPWNTGSRMLGDASNPTWYPDSTRFWYATRTANGQQFVLVDAARNTRSL